MFQEISCTTVASNPEPELRRLIAGLDALHLDSALPTVRAYTARGDALARSRAVDRQTFGDRRAQLVERLADGDLDMGQAATELVQLESLAAGEGALPKLVRDAAKRAHKIAWRHVVQNGERLLDDVAPLVADTVTEAIDIAANLPAGTNTLEDAAEAGASDKWLRLRELHAIWCRAHDLLDGLRGVGGLPVADDTGWPAAFVPADYRYNDPTAARHINTSPELAISAWASAGAAPGVYTAATVATRDTTVAV